MSEDTELIKERLDIAQIVGEYVKLKRAGQSYKGLCPFHQEKTPSFIVSPHRQSWHCFGCGKGGDVFSFVQEMEGMDFPAVLRHLAQRAGVTLASTGSSFAASNKRQRLLDLLDVASKLYHTVLFTESGARAREYLTSRGIHEDTSETYSLGYAPNSWDFTQRALAAKGFSEQEMIDAGLVGRSERGKLYDRFRGRIMFPISDVQGRVVAFGGRITPWHETGNEGKYVNSPETALYEKRKVVYNLHRAKHALRGWNHCVVVEGYMDALMLSQIGVENVVASSGTAFSREQIELLKRFTGTLHFAFDADSAGLKAAVSATSAALEEGMSVAVIQLPKGKDPADLAISDRKDLQSRLEHPTSLIAMLLTLMQSEQSKTTREELLEALLPVLSRVGNPIEQGSMIQEVSQLLLIPETRLLQLVQEGTQAAKKREQPLPRDTASETLNRQHNAEYILLGLLLENPTVRSMLFAYLEEEVLLDPKSHSLYNSMKQIAEKHPSFMTMNSEEIVRALDNTNVPFAEAVRLQAVAVMETTSQTATQEARQLFRALQRQHLSTRLVKAQEQLMQTPHGSRAKALHRFQLLANQLAQIDNTNA